MTVTAKSGAWTEEEDLLLTKYQALYGNKWSQVSQHIPGRNGQQCAQRWRHKVNPYIVKEKWTPEEDSLLTKLVQELGVGKWAGIARHLPGRTDQQCMGRWRRHLDPNIRKDAWSAEEDAELLELYREHGPAWSCIAKLIANRTPQQCRGRWCVLNGGSKAKGAASAEHDVLSPPGDGAAMEAVSTAGTSRRGRLATGCPSTIRRRTPNTEVPAAPASTTTPPQGGANQQPRRSSRKASAGSGAVHAQATVEPPQERAQAGQCSKSQCAAIATGHDGEVAVNGATSPGGFVVKAVRRGRLLLGTRVVSFRRQPRSTRQTSTRRAAPSGFFRARAPDPALVTSATAAAVARLTPPSSPSKLLPGDEEEVALLNGLLDDGTDTEAEPHGHVTPSPGAGPLATLAAGTTASALEGALGCSAASTGSGSVLHAAGSDHATTTVSTRTTRSGRCYSQLGASTSYQTLQHRPYTLQQRASGSKGSGKAHRSPESTAVGKQEDVDEAVDTVGQPDQGRQPPHPVHAAGPGEGVANAGAPPANAMYGGMPLPLPPVAEEPEEEEEPASGYSARSSFGLPDLLFGLGHASPSGGQPVDWQQVVGSPPTSSLLQLLEAGLLQTPSAGPSGSPGRDALRAPVPPGVPKVDSEVSNGWSDVPAFSWSAWRNCNDSFGIASRQPAASAHGTPDNTRLPPRALQDAAATSLTPRRDMFIRSAVPGHVATSVVGRTAINETLQALPDAHLEGHGATCSYSPIAAMKAMPAAVSHPRLQAARTNACLHGLDSARQGIPDCCSPSRGQRLPPPGPGVAPSQLHMGAAGGAVPAAALHATATYADCYNARATGLVQVQSYYAGCGHHGQAHSSFPNQYPGVKPVPGAFPVPSVGGTIMSSLHAGSTYPAAPMLLPSNGLQFAMPPALASALVPAPASSKYPIGVMHPPSFVHAPPVFGNQLATAAYPMPPPTGFRYNMTETWGSGNLPSGVLPRLALPKLAAPEPNQRRLTSVFPVLTLDRYQAGK